MNIERGNKFVVMDDRLRGAQLTCVGVDGSNFTAGTTGKEMFLFDVYENNDVGVFKLDAHQDRILWVSIGHINKEKIKIKD